MREIEASERIVLACRRCGEQTVLPGRTDNRYMEGHKTFACECGEDLTLADRVGEVDFGGVVLPARGPRATNGG